MDGRGRKNATETEISRVISIGLTVNRLITNSLDFITIGKRQHLSGVEYRWPHDVQGVVYVVVQVLSLDFWVRDKNTHSS